MFYVGLFSWVGVKPRIRSEGRTKGQFTLLAEADSVEEAGEKFYDLITGMRLWSSLFEDMARVHVEDLTEVRKLPDEGVLAFWEQTEDLGEGVYGSISASLPGVSEKYCCSYTPRWTDGAEEYEEPDEDEGWVEEDVEPFVTFVEEEDAPFFPPATPGGQENE